MNRLNLICLCSFFMSTIKGASSTIFFSLNPNLCLSDWTGAEGRCDWCKGSILS